MNLNADFRTYATRYFSRLVGGYARALDGTSVRAWIDGHLNSTDAGGAWDATSRTLPALAAWLASGRGAYAVTPRGDPVDIAAHVRAVFAHAFDPDHPGYWGAGTPHPGDGQTVVHQHTVEAASLAYAAWLLRDGLLKDLPVEHVARFREWLTYFGRIAYPNNWQLFLIVNHAARKALGWDFDRPTIDAGWDVINAFEREDGWMTDGPDGYFDDYNWWVFGTHELMWLQVDGGSNPALADRVRARDRRRLEDYPYFFAADGAYTEYGRSLSYKFARLALPLLAYPLGLWPHSPGMLKRLVRRHLAWYDDRGGIARATDTVRQELTAAGSPDVREPYINTGHPYWCMLAFAALWQISDADPLWACEEEPLPVERGDFSRTIKPAGWILEGVKAGGHVLRYALGSRHAEATYAPFHAKYSKFCYGSHFPVNLTPSAGGFHPDAALILSDVKEHAHPGAFSDLIVGDGFLSAAYALTLGRVALKVRTTLIPFGEICLRVHRLITESRLDKLHLYEGASPLGFSPGELPSAVVRQSPPLSAAILGGRASAIYGLHGHGPSVMKSHYQFPFPAQNPGKVSLSAGNAVYARAHIPSLWRPVLSDSLSLISLTLATLSGFREFWKEVSLTLAPDTSLRITCGPRTVTLPPDLSAPLS